MSKEYTLFDFPSIISGMRKDEKKRTETLLPYENLYGPLTEATQLEETPFFQEYLSLFNPDRELEGLTLWTKDDDYEGGEKPLFNGQEPSMDDYKMLQILIIGSFSNRYSIIPGPQPSTYRLGFQTMKSPLIYAVDQLFNFQIKGLYPAYIAEQMRLTVLLSSDERDQVWQQRTERLGLFQEKVGKLRGMMKGTPDSPQT
jgi:hypothetical protein